MQSYAAYGILLCVVLLAIYVIKMNMDRKVRINSLTSKCSNVPTLHVLFESRLGQHLEVAEMVAQLMDACDCPSKLQLHVLEPVSSIKAMDLLTPAIQKACSTQPNYATFFTDNVHILKVHQSRKLVGVHGINHLLSTLRETLMPNDYIMYFPAFSKVQKGWDLQVTREFQAHADLSTVFTYPLCVESSKDMLHYLKTASKSSAAQFFKLDPSLEFTVQDMSRSGLAPSIGISLRHPFGGCASSVIPLAQAASQADIHEDLALSYLCRTLGLRIMHGSGLVACRGLKRRSANKRMNMQSLYDVFSKYPDNVDAWLHEMALQISEDDEDLQIYGRAYMGMTSTCSKQEILVKWGSEEAFETEKEALKYG